MCGKVLWERFFKCEDLGKDLVPVVQAFKASEECRTGKPTASSIVTDPPLKQDMDTIVPDPFSLEAWVTAHEDELHAGKSLSLFGPEHPDPDYDIRVVGGPPESGEYDSGELVEALPRGETWVYQIRGPATLSVGGGSVSRLDESACCIIPAGQVYAIQRDAGTIGLVVTHKFKDGVPSRL